MRKLVALPFLLVGVGLIRWTLPFLVEEVRYIGSPVRSVKADSWVPSAMNLEGSVPPLAMPDLTRPGFPQGVLKKRDKEIHESKLRFLRENPGCPISSHTPEGVFVIEPVNGDYPEGMHSVLIQGSSSGARRYLTAKPEAIPLFLLGSALTVGSLILFFRTGRKQISTEAKEAPSES
ncbi:MAG: hypothetical protein KDA80_06305 [Planctomycetaceae bacterium]|nr:hypothetical protein [Planctomycetaceae bacterium]